MLHSIHWKKDSCGDEAFDCIIHVNSEQEIKILQKQILQDHRIVNKLYAAKIIIGNFPNLKCTNKTFSQLLQAIIEE